MAYNRFYTTFTDEQGWEYTLYVLPSNANASTLQLFLDSTLTSFTLVKLPDEFLMRDLKLDTELGEIPAGIVSQVMSLTCNIASLQGTTEFDELRECLLRGTVQDGLPYKTTNFATNEFPFKRFNTFILMVNDGSGYKPIFIGAQKYSAENELTVTKLDNVLEFKIECFDVMRFICESISGTSTYLNYLSVWGNSDSLDYGGGYSLPRNTRHYSMNTGEAYEKSVDNIPRYSYDFSIDKFSFTINTFANLKTLIDAMLTEFMKSVTWNTQSSISVPIPFAKAWTFYEPRTTYNGTKGSAIEKPAFVSEIIKTEDFGSRAMGGALIDPEAFGKFNNFYDLFLGIIENTLEIYRLQYAWSVVSGWFSVTYDSDYLRASQGSGITFAKSNIYSDVKMKFFQETVKNAKASVSTLQGEKDNKVFPYAEGSSTNDSKDIELIFHNLASPTGRVLSSNVNNNTGTDHWNRNAINAGIIVRAADNSFARNVIKKVDSQCEFKYSATDSVSLDYASSTEFQGLKGSDYNVIPIQQIVEQRNSGIPYTVAYSLVKALGDSKQVDLEFDSIHEIIDYSDVGKSCTINLNDLNPLLTKIYNANTGTGVITKHSLNVYSGVCSISVRMHG